MSTYDYETVEAPRRHKSHRHHHHHDRDRDRDRDFDPEPRYVETRETYVRGTAPVIADSPYPSRATDLIRRPSREDSDLSIEEVPRDFPPPGAAGYAQSRTVMRDDRYVSSVRSRSAERGAQYGQHLGDPRDDRRSRKKVVKEETDEPRRRSLSRNEKIIAAVGGAALAVGSKELWDRRQNDWKAPKDRNYLVTSAIGAAGALAGYEGAELYTKKFGGEKKVKKTYIASEGRNGEVAEYISSDEEREKPKSHRKSIVEGALGLAGLGAAAKAVSGGHDRDDRSDRGDRRSRRRSGSDGSRRRDKSRGGGDGEGVAKLQQSAKAALLAGAAEAIRVRKEPGGWSGAKGKRILTAAIGAGGINAAADRDPEHHSKRHILESVIAGLAGNRLINGPKRGLEPGGGKGGRSRSRSRGPSIGGGSAGLAALATAGLGALAGKKLLDRSRSRSRGPDDRDDRSSDEDDSDGKGRNRRRRSKSATGMARKGLAALGIGEAASEAGRDDKRRDRDKPRRRRGSSDDEDDDSRYGDSRDGGGRRSSKQKDGGRDRRTAEGNRAGSDTDSLGSSSGDEKRVKKMKGKQLLTAGLATVATIHAAHSVYQSYEKNKLRKKLVQAGKMSREEEKKLQTKARLQGAASVGIAALGIKGALSEWKEMSEIRHEYKEFEEQKEERHLKRLERQRRLNDGKAAIPGDDGDERLLDPPYASAPDLTYGGRYDSPGPHYADGNPYASGGLPAPPVGYAYESRR